MDVAIFPYAVWVARSGELLWWRRPLLYCRHCVKGMIRGRISKVRIRSVGGWVVGGGDGDGAIWTEAMAALVLPWSLASSLAF